MVLDHFVNVELKSLENLSVIEGFKGGLTSSICINVE